MGLDNLELLSIAHFLMHRFGFPVFVILNEKGERVHTQNSAYLEKGEGYSEKEVVSFLNLWNKKAVEEVPKK